VPLIIWHLSKAENRRFGELRRLMPKVTQKMLTQQLRNLERYEIVYREEQSGVPPTVEYSLTEMGRKLIPLFEDMNAWTVEYLTRRKPQD
jgi:DNA-binding HxlR family transcriptional regulator